MSPADDLRDLGIDRAERRWAAVLDYIAEQRELAEREFNRLFVCIVAARYAEQSASATPGWVGYFDMCDAIARVETQFGPKAAQVCAVFFLGKAK